MITHTKLSQESSLGLRRSFTCESNRIYRLWAFMLGMAFLLILPIRGASDISPNVWYQISAKNSGKDIDVEGGSQALGQRRVQIYDWLGGANQKWSFLPVNGHYIILSELSGDVLDVKESSLSNGAKIQQYKYIGSPNQLWDVEDAGNDYVVIRSVSSGKVLDVEGGESATSNGTNVQQYDYNATTNQQWKLVASGDAAAIASIAEFSGSSASTFMEEHVEEVKDARCDKAAESAKCYERATGNEGTDRHADNTDVDKTKVDTTKVDKINVDQTDDDKP